MGSQTSKIDADTETRKRRRIGEHLYEETRAIEYQVDHTTLGAEILPNSELQGNEITRTCNIQFGGRKRKTVSNLGITPDFVPATFPQNSKSSIYKQNRQKRMNILRDKRQRNIVQQNPDNKGTGKKKLKYRYLGDPEYECPHCGAIMWFDERVKRTSRRDSLSFNMCCKEGKIRLPKLKEAPPYLAKLLHTTKDKKDKTAAKFKKDIRIYNSCYAFTSMGANIDKSVSTGKGLYTFRISGQVFHRIGSLLPEDGQNPSYAQLYVYDTSAESEMRAKAVRKQENSPQLDNTIIEGLKNMLDEVNPLAQTFRMAQQRIKEEHDSQLTIKLLSAREQRDRTYNTPTTDEVAALITNGSGSNSRGRDIIVEHKSGQLQTISELHPSYMALQYPLLFPYGEDSFHLGIKYYTDKGKQGKRECVTMREYYAYRIQQRLSQGKTLLSGGRLFQQFLVDCCCAIETERLWYIKNNQQMFRCDVLNNLCDAVTKGDSIGQSVGQRIYLPASFTGSPRYMQQNYQDAMAICRWYGNPHLFITFTANSNWPEIDAMLKKIPDQTSTDRPDIVARVFKLKLTQLIDCLKGDGYFGTTIADVCTIEFQKRGLPHAHILLWLKKEEVDVTGEYINNIISAEIPDKNTEPELYEAVSKYMVHGPCGTANPECPCMVNNSCSKKFPKSFNEETTIDVNGYPIYRRRQDNRSIRKGKQELDNRSIVPYNPGLLILFDAHINVEWCNTARAIKYLFKYISKGPDKATIVIKDDSKDEIKTYLDCRYLSASEAAWRIFEFKIQDRYPSVMRLPVHLEGEQAVVIKDNDVLQLVIDRHNESETMLTSWMKTNTIDAHARKLSYAEFPTHYRWEKGWHRRKQGTCIGRITYVHPTAGERYYLRLLLNIVKGSRNYEEIRTVRGHLYPSFKEACNALGLLQDDKEWNEAMREANQWAMPSQLRELFVTMLLFCEVTDVMNLWETNFNMLSEDIERKKRKLFGHPQLILSEAAKQAYTMMEIDKILHKYGKKLEDIKNMPELKESDVAGMENKLIRDEKMYDREQLCNEWTTKVTQLNTDQLAVYEAVINSVNNSVEDLIFVYGHGGTGKTFLYGTISAKLRADNKIVLNVASSGIAALLLLGGRTAHSRFDIPIDLFDDSTCNVKQKTHLAELLQQTSLIIWDEAPMDHRFAFEALDRTMRDIVGFKDPKAATKIFGGKVVLLGGDFRQVLPIVPKGTRQDVVQASINRSHIWDSCRVFVLRTSMRVSETSCDEQKRLKNKKFNEWLLAMGDGRLNAKSEEHENEPTWIKIPDEYLSATGSPDLQAIVDEIYPNFLDNRETDSYIRERAILTPLNETADTINEYMTDLLPGNYKVYKSCDEICASSMDSDEQFTAYPTEYLNSLHIPGIPNHEIKLKEGMPVMLLRNINPSQGLCNGTRLIITRTGEYIVEARIITGSKIGQQVLIPRIVMTSKDTKIPFVLKRRQYPLKACYAMTINKSQGQSLTHVGVYLPKPVFSHGQLYVAASRTTSPEGLKFFIDDSKQTYKGHTRNIVYKEVFSNLPVVN